MVAADHCLRCPLISRVRPDVVGDRNGHESLLTDRALPIVSDRISLRLINCLKRILDGILVPLTNHVLGLLAMHVVLLKHFELLLR